MLPTVVNIFLLIFMFVRILERRATITPILLMETLRFTEVVSSLRSQGK